MAAEAAAAWGLSAFASPPPRSTAPGAPSSSLREDEMNPEYLRDVFRSFHSRLEKIVWAGVGCLNDMMADRFYSLIHAIFPVMYFIFM